MALAVDVPKLLDLFTRHQAYLEGVKLYFGTEFDKHMIELRKDIREIFFTVEYKNMSMFTKRELALFIRRLRDAQLLRFNSYTEQLLQDLQRLSEVDVLLTSAMLDEAQPAEKRVNVSGLVAPAALALLWARIRLAPIPANGILPETFVKRFTDYASDTTANLVNKAYANRLSLQETVQLVTGTSSLGYRDGKLLNYAMLARGLSGTLAQHVSSIVTLQAGSLYFDRYIWSSVLDSVTTPVCRSRNGNVYVFGQGPLPPAHMNCRSKIIPYDGSNEESYRLSYREWLARLPAEVQNDILGEAQATALRSGKLKTDEIRRFDATKPLSPEQFKAKLNMITT